MDDRLEVVTVETIGESHDLSEVGGRGMVADPLYFLEHRLHHALPGNHREALAG